MFIKKIINGHKPVFKKPLRTFSAKSLKKTQFVSELLLFTTLCALTVDSLKRNYTFKEKV